MELLTNKQLKKMVWLRESLGYCMTCDTEKQREKELKPLDYRFKGIPGKEGIPTIFLYFGIVINQ
jgi:hypothetical protein